MTADANEQSVNFTKISDEEQIYVAKEGACSTLGSSESPATSSASAETKRSASIELTGVRAPNGIRCIGQKRAQGHYRLSRRNGPFRSVDILQQPESWGETLEKLQMLSRWIKDPFRCPSHLFCSYGCSIYQTILAFDRGLVVICLVFTV